MELPEFFVNKLKNQYGEEITKKIIQGYYTQRKTTFRVNTLKSSIENIEKVLKEKNFEYEKVAWSEEAFVINNARENEIEQLDIYKNGEIYLQSLSSMLPPIILEPKQNSDILDMAAAPGGKTTQIAALSNNKAHITACEMNAIRAERLKYNIQKQGASSVYIMQKDSRRIDDFFSFDQILLDAPCSGTGTFNSNEKINITENFVQKISKTQNELLNKAVNVLKPGCEMIYSTCSILYEENEKNIEKILKTGKMEIVPIEITGMENMPLLPTKIDGTILLCPNDMYEGFFVTKMRKRS